VGDCNNHDDAARLRVWSPDSHVPQLREVRSTVAGIRVRIGGTVLRDSVLQRVHCSRDDSVRSMFCSNICVLLLGYNNNNFFSFFFFYSRYLESRGLIAYSKNSWNGHLSGSRTIIIIIIIIVCQICTTISNTLGTLNPEG